MAGRFSYVRGHWRLNGPTIVFFVFNLLKELNLNQVIKMCTPGVITIRQTVQTRNRISHWVGMRGLWAIGLHP